MADTDKSAPPAPRPPQRGGGIFIAAGVVLGGIGGVLVGQPSLGLVVGLGAGVLLAIMLVMLDRR